MNAWIDESAENLRGPSAAAKAISLLSCYHASSRLALEM